MKKFIQTFLVILITFTMVSNFNIQNIYAEDTASSEPSADTNSYSVKLNGSKLDLTLPILNVGNRLMYPFRECLDAMGATIDWDSSTKTASGTLGNYTVAFSVDSDFYTINGIKHQMDAGVKTFISDDRTYIPLRYAAEALNFNVGWDGSTQTVLIETVATHEGELARKQISTLADYKRRLPDYEVTMRASDGAVFIDGQQYSFPKEESPLGDTILPTFATNKMLDGAYPASWKGREYITFTEFCDSLIKIKSNQKLQNNFADLANTNFAIKGGDCIVWNNGAVSVGLFMSADSASANLAKLSLRAWHTYEEDLTTGNTSYVLTEIISTTNTYSLDNASFTLEFAQQLWDAMAFLDTATSQTDILSAQEACFLPT